jgi:hypothetical protein
MGELMEIISDFNNTLLSLAQNIAMVCPSSVIGTSIKEFEKHIKKPENLRKFIDLFSVKVLKYKDRIDNGDESFFMTNDYKDDLKGQGEDALSHVITMKSVWKELKPANKEIVILNMQILCALSLEYFVIATKK